MRNQVIFTGDGLKDTIKKFDLFTKEYGDLFSVNPSSSLVFPKAKYLLQKSNYLLFINCSSGTTFFPSRVYYSILNEPSSTTYNRFFDIRTNDGEELTGGGVMLNKVNFFKPSSVHEMTATAINLDSLGGDIQLEELVNGFGLKAPRLFENIGLYYVIGSQDSIRLYDGGRRVQLTVTDGSAPISQNIKPLLDKLIKARTYEKMVCKYYKKRGWLMFSYEDPDKFPRGKNNSVIFYDIKNKEWYPICGWLADTFETFDGLGDNGDLVYGDSNDGTVYFADKESAIDNAPKNLIVDTMDSSSTWSGVSNNYDNVVEGTGSLRMWISPSVVVASMTSIRVMALGEYPDKTRVDKTTSSGYYGDKLVFKYLTTNTTAITSLRVDLEINDINGSVFDQNFTSVTLTSATLNARTTFWTTVEIALSSFPMLNEWTAYNSETFPFAKALSYYGIRFAVTGIDVSSVSIDDIRIVQGINPLNFYRFSKLYDFGSVGQKTFGQIVLTTDRQRDSSLSMDIYNDFGNNVSTKKLLPDIPRSLIVVGFTSTASLTEIDDIDFSIKTSTVYDQNNLWPLGGVANNDHIYMSNFADNSLWKITRHEYIFVSSYGSIGSGTTNFNVIHQIDLDDSGNIYIVDLVNNRTKIHSQSDLSYISESGSLGLGTDNLHLPTGITCDKTNCYVADEGNARIIKFNKSTFSYTTEVEVDFNSIGDASLDQDESFVYMAYNKISDDVLGYQDVVLEKRFKGNMEVVNRIRLYPQDSVALSTYAVMGDIAIRGRYIYIPFTDNEGSLPSATYYIQKRLRSDLSLVKEYKTRRRLFSVIGDAFAHKPATRSEKIDLGTEGRYIQIKYYDEGIDNNVGLVNQTFLIEPQTLTY